MTDGELDATLEAIADFCDVKSPYTIGHSKGVAELVATAASSVALTRLRQHWSDGPPLCTTSEPRSAEPHLGQGGAVESLGNGAGPNERVPDRTDAVLARSLSLDGRSRGPAP
jgi:hypothetical protein